MEKEKTIKMLTALANGIDPLSGEVFPSDSIYNNVEISRTLFNAIDLLKNSKPKPKKLLPANSHQPWTAQLDSELSELFLKGTSINDIALFFHRSKAGIEARLIKLKLLNHYSSIIKPSNNN